MWKIEATTATDMHATSAQAACMSQSKNNIKFRSFRMFLDKTGDDGGRARIKNVQLFRKLSFESVVESHAYTESLHPPPKAKK